MKKIFIASQLPEKAMTYLDNQSITFDYWTSPNTISEAELIDKLKDVSILVCGIDVSVTKDVIQASPQLKLIANVGDGFSNIDTDFAKENNILITNAPTTDSIASTAEQTVTLLLSLSRKLLSGDTMMKEHKFQGWKVTGYVGGHQVYRKKIVIIGMGKIGRKVVEMLAGFKMDFYYVDPKTVDVDFATKFALKKVSLENGLKLADYVTINCSLNEENVHMISSNQLSLMKPSAYLINCARGPLVNEKDLCSAITQNQIAGAALDVYEFEPKVSKELAQLDNVVLTPHAGNATVEARNEMAMDAVYNVVKFITNKPLDYIVGGTE
ncbi:NAD(P)-dependent oxidoreductase [Enterococcus sp. LJL99]